MSFHIFTFAFDKVGHGNNTVVGIDNCNCSSSLQRFMVNPPPRYDNSRYKCMVPTDFLTKILQEGRFIGTEVAT